MAYIDCDKCYHGRVCAYRHHYHDMITDCNHHIPTDDVAEIKHGKWKEIKCGDGIFDYFFRCSICEGATPLKGYVVAPDYCPECGARMDGRSDT